jgi:hypothetical protein
VSIETPWTEPVDQAEAVDQAGQFEPAELDQVDDVDQTLPEPPLTGDQAVDHAVAEVARAVVRPLEDQVAVIDAAHRTLQDRLADVEG